MKRLVVLLITAAAAAAVMVLGATGTSTVAVAAQGTFPPGGQSTYEGEIIGISCGAGQQIIDPVATYYDKHANVVQVVTQPFVSAVNQYGEVVSAGYRTPKKAVYVVFSYTCAPETQPAPTPSATSSPAPTPSPSSSPTPSP